MTRMVLDETLRMKLNGLNEEIEVCDESGRTVGHFLPVDVYKKLLSAAFEEPSFTPEEIECRRKEKGVTL